MNNEELEIFGTEDELKAACERYEQVRCIGCYNMLDPRATVLSGLTKEQYRYIICNYSDLNDRYSFRRD